MMIGPQLRWWGSLTPIPMPAALLVKLPVFNAALPSRLALVVAPVVGAVPVGDPAERTPMGTRVDGVDVLGALSPSRASDFRSCPLQFRFSVIDRLPEPPSPAASKGTLVHRALELLMLRPPADRTPEAALADLERARHELAGHPEFAGLELSE